MCACLEHMKTHAKGNGFHQICMSCTDYRLDNLEGNVVRQIIQDTLKISPAFIVVYLKEEPVSEPPLQTTQAVNQLIEAQEADGNLR